MAFYGTQNSGALPLVLAVDQAGLPIPASVNIDSPSILTLLNAAAAADGAAQTNLVGSGAVFFVNITALGGTTPTATFKIQGQDPASLGWYDILTSAAIGAVGLTPLRIYPGIAAIANVAASDVLPRTFRVRLHALAGTTPTVTATVGLSLLL